ncbi:hypothetical protein PHMEG_0003841 [Phytophthora megakarya]|uniref:Uncharacterized protein n=1 Tax=Phytophthora megakarya TaxID=4795 RepID=A0A225WWV9_9STRA|nr:hypothetical protein PHMEG_0003841 [Phytophthora megakarya]
MPKTLPWQVLALSVDGSRADKLLDYMMSFETRRSIQWCDDLGLHKMRYRLMDCGSDVCASASEFTFGWRGKMQSCLQTDLVSVYTMGST